MNLFSKCSYASLSLMMCFSANIAAQNGDTGQVSIEEVIVTGQKFDRSLQDTPTSVAIVSADDIEKQNILNFSDALSAVPNVSFEPGSSTFQIRGVRSTGVTNTTGSDLASFYLDGATLPSNIVDSELSAWDIAQVEILRGPQSTLQGRNALAGAIVVNTTEPSDEWEGKARAVVGEFGRQELAIAFGGGLIEDQLAFRVTAEDRSDDGFNTNRFLDRPSDFHEDETYRLRLKAEPKAIPGFVADFSYTRNENRNGVDVIQQVNRIDIDNSDVLDPPFRTINQDLETTDTNENDLYKLELDYDLSDIWSVKLVSNFTRGDAESLIDDDQTPEPISENFSSIVTDAINQELRFTFDYDNFKGLVGVYYSDEDTSQFAIGARQITLETIGARQNIINFIVNDFGQPEFVAAALADQALGFYADVFPTNLLLEIDQDIVIENRAIFFDGTYIVNDQFEIFGGLRFDREEQSNVAVNDFMAENRDQFPDPIAVSMIDPTLGQIVAATNAFFDVQAAEASQDEPLLDTSFSELLPKFGVSYHITGDQTLNVLYQRGYRSGGVGFNRAQGTSFIFGEEFSDNFEISYRSSWFDNRLTLNGNLFFIDWTDQQVSTQLSPNNFDVEILNAGESTIRGFELEASYAINDYWLVDAGLGLAQTNFEEFFINAENPDMITRDLSGFEFADSSPVTANFNILYANGNFIANLNGNYKSTSRALQNPYTNSTEIPGDIDEEVFFNPNNDARWIMNARVGYEWEHLNIFLTAQNLFDEEYFISPSTQRRATEEDPGTATLGEPRQLALEIGYNF